MMLSAGLSNGQQSDAPDKRTLADIVELENLVRRFYKAYESKSVEDQLSLWSPTSTDLFARRQQIEGIFALFQDPKVDKLLIHKAVVEGDTAYVRTTTNVVGLNRQTGKPFGTWFNKEYTWTYTAIRENHKWKLVKQIRSPDHFAEKIVEAPKTQRHSLIEEEPDLVNGELVSAIMRRVTPTLENSFGITRALDILEFAKQLAERIKEPLTEYRYQTALYGIYFYANDGSRALASAQRLLELAGDNTSLKASFLNNIGNAYLDLGQNERALAAYRESLRLREIDNAALKPVPQGNIMAEASQHAAIGRTLTYLGDFQQAERHFKAQQKIVAENGLSRSEGSVLSNLGDLARVQGHLDAAAGYYQEALGKLGNGGFLLEITLNKNLADVFWRKGNLMAAIEYAEAALKVADSRGWNHRAWEANVTAARAHGALGEYEQALAILEPGLVAVEGLPLAADEEASRRRLEDRSAAHRLKAELLLRMGKPAASFEAAERAKSRVLLGTISGTSTSISIDLTNADRQEEERLLGGIKASNVALRSERQKPNPDSKRISLLEKDLASSRQAYEAFRTKLYSRYPHVQIARGDWQHLNFEQVGGLLPSPKTAVLQFLVHDDSSFAYVVTLDNQGKPKLSYVEVRATLRELALAIEQYRSALATGDLSFNKRGEDLFTLLIEPVRHLIGDKNKIIIVPDGPLWDLPFQALQDGKGTYLIEKVAIAYAPSLTALREMRKKTQAKADRRAVGAELLGFGNPIVGGETKQRVQRVFMNEKLDPLPEAERLVNELGRMYGAKRSKVFVGAKAREQVAKQEAPKYRIVQFATHGILNNVSPMYSHLVFARDENDPSEDGLLEAWELKDLNLNADMVILSACDTARGKIANGEGVIGMTWASFIAGAPTTVASQWKVESSSTTELMLEFHRQLLTGKVSKAEALRRASLKLMRSAKYKHPSYWGGWVLVGDGN